MTVKNKIIGFYRVEHTALSLSMRLMDKFDFIKLDRKKNNGFNSSFPKEKYPFMLVLISGAKIEACKKLNSEHFAKMKYSKMYKAKYDLSKAQYRQF